MLARAKTLAGIAKETELNPEAETVHRTTLRSHQCQVVGAGHVVPGHFGAIGRNGEEAGALLGGQQGAAGHGGLSSVARGPFINRLPLKSILQKDSATRFVSKSFAKVGKPIAGTLLGYARVSKGDEQTRACRQLSQMAAATRWMAPRKFRAVLS